MKLSESKTYVNQAAPFIRLLTSILNTGNCHLKVDKFNNLMCAKYHQVQILVALVQSPK